MTPSFTTASKRVYCLMENNFLKLYLLARQSYREKKRGKDSGPSAGSLPKWPQWPGLGQAEASSFLQVSHVGAEDQVLGPFSAALPSRELGKK